MCMNWLDLAIVLCVAVAFVRGIQNGFVQQIFSLLGFVVGVLVGSWLQGQLIGLVHSAQSKSILALAIIIACSLLCMTIGEYVGAHLRRKLENAQLAKSADRAVGSILAVTTILLAVWFGAAMFNNAPILGLQQHIRNSRIVAALNNTLPSAPGVVAKIGHFINPNGFPQVFTGLEPRLQTDAPLPELGDLKAAVEQARPSVVKIAGEGCGGIVEGSGFIVGEGLVMTNAHVVAGVKKPIVIDSAGDHDTTVVWFDPKLDIAIVRTGALAGAPLPLNTAPLSPGTPGVVLGYPQGSGFTASPAVILESFTANGRDIYNQENTRRSVHSIKTDIRQGNSGGPLLAADGSVIGVIFAESTTYQDVGYALSSDQAKTALDQARSRTQAVTTGQCTQ